MSRRKAKAISRTKLIAFKVSLDADPDIVTWWEGLPEGERSEALRLVIRAFLGRHVQVEANQSKREVDTDATRQVANDTAWIRASLMELPGYLERLVKQVSLARPVATVGEETINTTEPEQPRLEDEAVARRRDKIGKNRW